MYQRLNEDDACHTLSPYFRLQLDADNEDISNVTIHTCASCECSEYIFIQFLYDNIFKSTK